MTLEAITHPALQGTQHGFFTRKGGASSGVFAGLNCGFGSSDQHDVVEINRERVAAQLQVAPDRLVGVHQIHSAVVVPVMDAMHHHPKADGLVTATPGVALSILTADCQPVLFSDQKAGVIGAAHAGWKGALHGVLEETVRQMETLGAARANITAVIGPSISQRNYEVGPEFRTQFLDVDDSHSRFFAAGKDGRFQFDLPAFGIHRLRSFGVGKTSWTRHCTYADPDRFYSYRRSVHQREADYGRLISAIRL
ncbi:peptidoglycan editing factor PgeF [Yoonia sp. BS5-3]|uniref:Purine nucleoside phosphorylase n=1 Tax=Yoonia phaeophyticola TaxID=3137369 RepID=A0ABZ2VB69_9RHOB